MTAANVWVVDDDEGISWVLQKALQKAGYVVTVYGDAESVVSALDLSNPENRPDLILTDVRMPGHSGFWLTEQIKSATDDIPVIVMTGFGDLDSAVESFKKGAFEYITKPFDINEVLSLVSKALDNKSDTEEKLEPTDVPATMLGESEPMQQIFRTIGRLSGSSMNVLIRGESGAGKELVAQALHTSSGRGDQAMVSINIAAIPSELLESELFGHEKGAFTGADSRRIGRFEQSNGGTLFLDEIGDMPLELQTRLLRVLSEGRFFRVGGREEVNVDVRVISATNQNLERHVDQGLFRLDLYHRLNVIAIDVPPLRDRADDIPLLAAAFMGRASEKFNVESKRFSPEVMNVFRSYPWPGNVRELENLVQRLIIMAPGKQIQVSDLPPALLGKEPAGSTLSTQAQNWHESLKQQISNQLNSGERDVSNQLDALYDRALIESALKFTNGHRRKAAEALGWGRNTLTRKIQQLNIH